VNRSPAFQFYAADWFDFRVQRMSLAAQGAYIKLLAFMWKDSPDQCSILDDDRLLAKSLGISISIWKKLREEMQMAGDPILIQVEGRLVSKRLSKEAEKQRTYRAEQADKGRRSAQQRLNHGSTTVQPEHQPEGNSSSSSPSSSPSSKKLAAATAERWAPEAEFVKSFLKTQESLKLTPEHLAALNEPAFWERTSVACNGINLPMLQAEFAKMGNWVADNPARAPTPRGVRRFVADWLNREAEHRRRRGIPG